MKLFYYYFTFFSRIHFKKVGTKVYETPWGFKRKEINLKVFIFLRCHISFVMRNASAEGQCNIAAGYPNDAYFSYF